MMYSASEAMDLREVMEATGPGAVVAGFTAKAQSAAGFVRDYSALGLSICERLLRPSGALP
jgi:hypothetical protein